MSIETGKRQVLQDAVLDFPSVGANDSEVLTVTVPQAKVGNAVHVNAPFNVVATKSQGELTLDVIPVTTNTMTVDGKVYTFLDTITDADGDVFIGANVAASQANIVAAFDLSGVAGTDYGLNMTAHPTVDMAAFAADASILTAKLPGAAGDAIDTTETFGPATDIFDAATLGTERAGSDSSGLSVSGLVSVADTVTVVLTNATAGALDPDSGTYRVTVWF